MTEFFSRWIAPHAITIARAFDSQITLLHVMDTPREARWRRAMDLLNWQIRKAEATAYLSEVELRLQASGLLTETYLPEGTAAEQTKRLSISVTGATYHC